MSKVDPKPRGKRKITAWWSVSQIAELLGVDRKTVRRWIDAGELRGMRLPPGEKGQQERRVHYDILRDFLVRMGYTRYVRPLDTKMGVTKPAKKTGKEKS